MPANPLRPTAIAAAAVVALVVAGTVGARGAATSVQLRVTLSAAQEAPAPTGDVSNARGTFAGRLVRSGTGASLEWTLTSSGLTGPAVAAHIHTGAPGQPGPVVVPLCGPCSSPAGGTATVDAALLSAIQGGQAYVNVHTPANRAGEIRAQLASVASTTAKLNARQEVPRPRGRANRARGTFSLTATKNGADATIAWRLTFSRLTGRALAAHIHVGARGRAGGVAVPLCGPCRSAVRGTARVSGATLAALESGRAYVNVHTRQNPGGEIRGQLAALPLTITP
ncbi:MAG TPA: CHRD domain-containing protein [Gaiellaceae bacterium]|nr:CHRD domain-containing protein [Gaiellaceae bacterium]